MEEWKTYRIKDICLVNTNQYSAKDGWQNVLYLDTGNITENHIGDIQFFSLPSDELPSRARRKVKHNDIVFSTVRPNQRHYGILNHPANNLLVSTGFTVLTAKPEIADPYFVYYYLTQSELIDYLQGVAEQSVSAYPSLKSSDIEEIEIALPPIAEQKRLSSVLRSLDSKIELNNRINHNLEEQSQALYKSWFVDFEPFKDDKFVDSELGMIPEGWKVLPFSAFVQISNEKVDSKHIPEFSVTNTGIFPRDAKFNKRLSSSSLTNKVIRKGDLVFGMSREILNWGIMDEVIGGVSSAYTVYKIEKHIIDENYLRSYIQHHIGYFKDLIKPAAREGQGIDKKVLASKMAIIPEESIWNGFQKKVNSIIAAKRQLMNQTEQLAKLRDEMLPILMGRKAV